MAEKKGCFKTGCLGCLGMLAVGVLVVGISTIVAWRGASDRDIVDREIAAPAEVAAVADSTVLAMGQGSADAASGKGGRLVLQLKQGEFELHRGEPGQTLMIKANFDDDIYNLEDRFETLADSTWVYEVRFYRTIGGMQALLRQLVGGGHDNQVHVYLPPDVPIELVIQTEEGGFNAELGGLWLTAADITFSKGGFNLEFDEPLREPLDSLLIQGGMGGFNAEGLGNASPRVLGVSCSMGGANLEMNGLWRNDCDARLHVKMGGMSVLVPDEIMVEGVDLPAGGMVRSDREVALPVLRISTSKGTWGEIEIVR
jgi:hypothetical protein